jgi:hypothetical protein
MAFTNPYPSTDDMLRGDLIAPFLGESVLETATRVRNALRMLEAAIYGSVHGGADFNEYVASACLATLQAAGGALDYELETAERGAPPSMVAARAR